MLFKFFQPDFLQSPVDCHFFEKPLRINTYSYIVGNILVWPSGLGAGLPVQNARVKFSRWLHGWLNLSFFRGWWNEYQEFLGT